MKVTEEDFDLMESDLDGFGEKEKKKSFSSK